MRRVVLSSIKRKKKREEEEEEQKENFTLLAHVIDVFSFSRKKATYLSTRQTKT